LRSGRKKKKNGDSRTDFAQLPWMSSSYCEPSL